MDRDSGFPVHEKGGDLNGSLGGLLATSASYSTMVLGKCKMAMIIVRVCRGLSRLHCTLHVTSRYLSTGHVATF